MKSLRDLRWVPHWVSHLGCIRGCIDYLGIGVTDGWLYGGTGHAFVLNVHEGGSCPSGPTAWNHHVMFALAENLGLSIEGVTGVKERGELRDAQKRAWDLVRSAIDAGVPCYGWELKVPEYYVIYGYDEVGYHYSGPGADDGAGPKPWRELADTGIGWLEMRTVKPGKAADAVKTVRDALAFALEIGRSSDRWILPRYHGGLAGYDAWIRAMEDGSAGRFGVGYNASVWAKCRRMAPEFLREAKGRLPGDAVPLLDDAASRYEEVSRALDAVADAYPFSAEHSMEPIGADDRSAGAAQDLRRARGAEEAGLAALERLVERLT
jgi:hypothetical protein